jgi:hypothetical protein
MKIIGDVRPSTAEAKVEFPSARESFRREYIHTLITASNDSADQLREELSRKNIELRTKTAELEAARAANRVAIGSTLGSTLGTGIATSLTTQLLEECQRDRRLLQEKIYDLKRDIERASSSGASSSELSTLRARNAQLEASLAEANRAHSTESSHISTLSAELANCRRLLDEVLSAQEAH